jgi:hypothetical protein
MNDTTRIHLKDTTEVVAYIAAKVSESLAAEGFPGHDLETVMTRMTSDRVLATIRGAYTHMARRGDDRPSAISKIGVRLIAEYYTQHNL